MSVMGVGAKIATPTLLWLAVAEVVSRFASPAFGITGNYTTLLVIGIILIFIGFSLNMVAAVEMLKAHKEILMAGARRRHTGIHLLQDFRARGAQVSGRALRKRVQ
jgi:hypothetical protein